MKVKDILSGSTLISVREDDELGLAMQIMMWGGVHHLPVLSTNDKLLGVLTERDILVRHTQLGRAAAREPVTAAMSMTTATVMPDEDVAEAALRMIGHGASCLPVVAAGRVVAMLTTTDLAQYLAEPELAPAGPGPTAADAMHPKPLTAAADDHLMDALARMAEHRIRHLPVVSGDQKVIGMLSDRDIRSAIGDPTQAMRLEETLPRLQSMRVEGVMSRPVITVTVTAPLAEVAQQLCRQHIGAVPVVDEAEHLVGIISYVDLLRAATFKERAPADKRPLAARCAPQVRA